MTFEEASDPLRWRRLVYRMARRLPAHMRADAVQDGWEAVLLAIESLDPERYTGRPLGYMAQRIRWHQYQASSATIYIPAGILQKVIQGWQWERTQNRHVTSVEIAEAVGLDPLLFATAEASMVSKGSHGRRNRDDGDGWATLGVEDDSPTPEATVARAQIHALTVRALAEADLSDRELSTIQDGTLTDIGQTMGISRERVRQIRMGAYRKLRVWFAHQCPEVVVPDHRSSQPYLRLERQIATLLREYDALRAEPQWGRWEGGHRQKKAWAIDDARRHKAALLRQVREPEAPPAWFIVSGTG